MSQHTSLSILIPARNEAVAISALLPRVKAALAALQPERPAEIIVIDDGSNDQTGAVASAEGVRVLSLPYGMGNGAAIKKGVRAAKGEIIVCLDADGQHPPENIADLLTKLEQGYDMVVGARTSPEQQAGFLRALANRIYNRFASWMVGQTIADLTSGFRAVRAEHFRRFLYLLPNGFSYPTTLTMGFFRSGLSVAYVPVAAISARDSSDGNSHIRPLADGVGFFLIIFKVGAYFSPLRIFLPFSLLLFATGLGYYVYTFVSMHRLTNMSVILFINALLVFLIGIVSEQITALMYKDSDT